jgi:TRAP-type C4-dicarboxylate transport system permease small subunit
MTDHSQEEGAATRSPVLRWTRGTLTALVAIVMFVMMMVTTIDVAGRAFFNLPIKGSDEIVSFLLAVLIFAALPLITWDQQHITVTLFGQWIRGTADRILSVLLSTTSTIVVIFIAYRMWIQADLMREGQHITGALQWPIAPVVYAASVLSGLTALILVVLTWQKLTGRETLPPPQDPESMGSE